MPHDPDVLREINESGIGTRAFLELSVSGNVNSGGGRGYTMLQKGQHVSLKAGKHIVEARVMSLKPDVRTLFDHRYSLPIDTVQNTFRYPRSHCGAIFPMKCLWNFEKRVIELFWTRRWKRRRWKRRKRK